MTCTAGLILACAVVSFTSRPGAALAAFGDITQLLLLALASTVMVANAVSNGGQTRLFWSLMAVGCFMWTANQAMWTFYEVVLGRALPDPFVGDVILFLHVVPLMAAALRPHRALEEHKLYSSTLNFLMLLVWWMFLYAFIVFPDEYVVLDKAVVPAARIVLTARDRRVHGLRTQALGGRLPRCNMNSDAAPPPCSYQRGGAGIRVSARLASGIRILAPRTGTDRKPCSLCRPRLD